jgi:site-specific recombinase XerD
VKQQLAAIRMLFDFLVTGQIVPVNPASSVLGPKRVVRRGKTPVLESDEARTLIDSINTDLIGLTSCRSSYRSEAYRLTLHSPKENSGASRQKFSLPLEGWRH